MPTHVVLIDASYFICYRYYAVRRWWSYARGEEPAEQPFTSLRFAEKYKTTFASKLGQLPHLIGLNKTDSVVKMVALDCPATDVWRRAVWTAYKGTRKPDEDLKLAFEVARDENLFETADLRLEYPSLEADDCIALAVRHILPNTAEDLHLTIVSGDRDYLQLLGPRVRLVDLNGKVIAGSVQREGGAARDLICKVLSGDKSDNIPAVAPRIGLKTAQRLYSDPAALERLFRRKPDVEINYKRNYSLVAFEAIPTSLVTGFYEKYRAGLSNPAHPFPGA